MLNANRVLSGTLTATANQNYVAEDTFLDETDPTQVSRKISYFDGLGRGIQSIAVQAGGQAWTASTAATDLVSSMIYDAFGRESVKLLPVALASGNGNIQASQDQNSTTAFYNGLGKTGTAYTSIQYEASPLNRVLSQTTAGSTVAMSMAYSSNVAAEVKMFSVDPSTQQISIGTYPANRLSKTSSTNENGQVSTEYKDLEGRTICKDNSGLKTYYVYDDLGQLVCVIPPKASSLLTGSSLDPNSPSNDLLFAYKYDERGRMTKKKVPGAGAVKMVYDNNTDLLTSTLDSVGNTVAYVYDGLNRITKTSNGTGQTLTQNYFDGYPTDAQAYQAEFGQSLIASTLGMATGSRAFVLGTDGNPTAQSLLTVPYYDALGRLIQSVGNNHLGGIDRSSMLIDLAGRVLKSKQQQSPSPLAPSGGTTAQSGAIITIETKQVYDLAGRSLALCQKTSSPSGGWGASASFEPISRLTYNSIGELNQKNLGCNVQNLDYTYNIKGWVTGINDPNTLVANKDFFGMNLAYDAIGNINTWNYQSTQRKGAYLEPFVLENRGLYQYGFTYDNINRLKSADLVKADVSVFGLGGNDNGKMSYDDNGSITSLKRTFNGSTVDNMAYNYAPSSNKLANITDTGTNPAVGEFFKDGNANYTYDNNGNLTSDTGKGISNISYNYLNLVRSITINGKVMTYTYATDGKKLSADSGGGPLGNNKKYDYLETSVLLNSKLEFIPMAEGRLTPTKTGGLRYEYELKDHLNDSRLSCACLADSGLVVLQENHFDPWGLDLPLGIKGDNRYKFLSREDITDLVGVSDLQHRFYDRQRGQFWEVDPVTAEQESLSTFQYGWDNPIKYSDPTGECIWCAGAIAGGAAGFTGGASLLATAGAAGAANGLGGAASNIIQGKAITFGSVASDVATGFLSGAAGKLIGNALGKVKGANPCGCFVEGTQVLTDNGHKQIELIKKGDKVWAYDAKSGKLAIKAVTHTFAVVRDTIYAITIGQQIIRASSDHPFFIGGKWLKVKNLKVGQKVKLYNGTLVPITAIEIVFEPTKVYNFTVANFHTYYVSKSDVLVHNCNYDALKKGRNGTTVNVKTKAEAHEVLTETFPNYQKVRGVGSQDAQGIRKLRKMEAGSKPGTYHKDYAIDSKTGRVRGHAPDNPHGDYPHINIKREDGKKVIINIVGR